MKAPVSLLGLDRQYSTWQVPLNVGIFGFLHAVVLLR